MQGLMKVVSKAKQGLLVVMLSWNNSFNHLAFSYNPIIKTR
jgi:hypothetical protein